MRSQGLASPAAAVWQDPAWYKALTLVERLVVLRERRPVSAGALVIEPAAERLSSWRQQPPFGGKIRFEERLVGEGISKEDLLRVLAEPLEGLQRRFLHPPDWLRELCGAYSWRESAPARWSVPSPSDCQDAAGFVTALEPLLRRERRRARRALQRLSPSGHPIPSDGCVADALVFADLARDLVGILARTMVLEVNVARLRGVLRGDTAEARFASFVERLSSRETVLALFLEYPVLARQVTMALRRRVSSRLECLARLSSDLPAIRAELFGGMEVGRITGLEVAGDRHGGGRSVLILTFSSGSKLVYKPRPLAVDRHFQQLLAWLNARGEHPPFRTQHLLDRGAYGWASFVSASGCTDPEEVRRFYVRQGAYLALLQVLHAVDFHFENIIAAGEHPVLVDVETLFHPYVGAAGLQDSALDADHALNERSLLRVGLLPQRTWLDGDEGEGIDASGLGAVAGQMAPRGTLRFDAPGSDRVRLLREAVELPPGRHRPSLHGCDIRMEAYADAIVEGFTGMYRVLMTCRRELAAAEGPIARFKHDEVRVLLRPTRVYELFLQESFHPDVLRDALDRDRLFDRLWAAAANRPHLARAIVHERADLWRGDIPKFVTRPDCRDVRSSGGKRIAGLLAESGMELVHRRLRELSDVDLTQQLWLIRASMWAHRGIPESPGSFENPEPPGTPATREALLTAARSVGDRLLALAFRLGEHLTWVDVPPRKGAHPSLVCVGPDLYRGQAGLVLFLAYLGATLRDGEAYTAAARAALARLREQLGRHEAAMTRIGAFEGWGGIVYTLGHLAAVWSEPRIAAEAQASVRRVPPLVDRDREFDVIGGAAGCILTLLSLNECVPRDSTLSAAVHCGDHLLRHARKTPHGIGWETAVARRPLAGFGHGLAGMAAALFKLAEASGMPRFRDAASSAVAHERTLFVPDKGNWLDLREYDGIAGGERFMTAWCHGAVGVGLARLHHLRYVDADPAARQEVMAALANTAAEGFGRNYSLCHGDVGSFELLAQAADALGEPTWRALAMRRAAATLARIDRHGWAVEGGGVETPGLMVGLAGVGYGLLRLAEPEKVPSVLVLAPPAGAITAPPVRERPAGLSSAREALQRQQASGVISPTVSAPSRNALSYR